MCIRDSCYIPENSLGKIYLNFSTPLPKLGYATQRLTHRNFLEIYKKLLKKGGRILQKTDNRDFFEFSLEEYTACGFRLEKVTYDLHKDGNPKENIVTEYLSLIHILLFRRSKRASSTERNISPRCMNTERPTEWIKENKYT